MAPFELEHNLAKMDAQKFDEERQSLKKDIWRNKMTGHPSPSLIVSLEVRQRELDCMFFAGIKIKEEGKYIAAKDACITHNIDLCFAEKYKPERD